MKARITSLLALLLIGLQSAAIAADKVPDNTDDPKDTTIVLGKRVGAITPGMTILGLKTIYGPKNIKPAQLDGPEGSTLDGLKLFPGTEKELHLVLEQQGDEKVITDAIIVGKAWKFSNGLKPGMSIGEIQKINGKPFTISGFGWDYGGYGNFEGGSLFGKISIEFEPKQENLPDKLLGERQIPSTDKDLIAAKPVASGPFTVLLRKD